jgi:DNA-binding transcriptional regulator GbsR (MarR family)
VPTPTASRGSAPGRKRRDTGNRPAPEQRQTAPERAEAIRRSLADAWGDMGAAWGVAPAIARVHGYLLSRQAPLTEREVREALGLSHRAASMALAESAAWGLVVRVQEPRRVGRRGPAGVAYAAIGDHWRWFGRVVAQRKLREGDPVTAVLADAVKEATKAAREYGGDSELTALRDWLASFYDFVRLFDRAIGIVPQLEPRELERALRLVARVPDETALRLVRLLVTIPDEDVVPLLDAMSRLSPSAARRATKLIAGVVRTVGR